jgi:hypothetical protein
MQPARNRTAQPCEDQAVDMPVSQTDKTPVLPLRCPSIAGFPTSRNNDKSSLALQHRATSGAFETNFGCEKQGVERWRACGAL